MDVSMTSSPAATPARPGPEHDPGMWRQWVVALDVDEVRDRLFATSGSAPGYLVADDAAPTSGTLTDSSRRWGAAWTAGGGRGRAEVELTPLGPATTLVEVCLRPAATRPAVLDRWRRRRAAAATGRALGQRRARRPRRDPALVGLARQRRPGTLPRPVWLLLVALLFTPTVWALIADQGPTAVSEERALAEHRARLQELTSTPTADRSTGDERPPATDDGRDGGDAESTATPVADGGGDDQEASDDGTRSTGDTDRAAATTNGAPEGGADGSTDAREPATQGVPEPGVYQYATDGSEAVDVPGGSRDYPERTTISVTEEGCGSVARWRVLDERWDEREVCEDGRLAGQTTYREFYGVAEHHEFDCEEERDGATATREPGRSWAITCTADDARMQGTITVVGDKEIDVRGTTVPTVHLRLDGELSGGITGTQRTERWLAADLGGLLIREESRTRATVDSPMGEVDYREDYLLDLLDLRPRT